jgi:hypothetical protein
MRYLVIGSTGSYHPLQEISSDSAQPIGLLPSSPPLLSHPGAIGLRFCQQALASNHTLVLYVRDKSRLDPLLANSPGGVTVVEGELVDRETLASALKDGVDAGM